MDTSPKYIEMCEKAEEIQHARSTFILNDIPMTNFDRGDWYYEKNRIKPAVKVKISPGWSTAYTSYLVWLPRQDQLQEMMDIKTASDVVSQEPWYSLYAIDFPDSSPEVMWLSLVMEIKFGKTWNGKEWVKA